MWSLKLKAEADMKELDIDREDINDRKKLRRNVMKRKSNPIGKRTIKRCYKTAGSTIGGWSRWNTNLLCF